MSEKPKPCYREVNGAYFTRNDHRHDCEDVDCRGCVTCPGRHCTAKRNCCWHIDDAENTCGRCIAGVRRELRWIGDLAALMLTQAIADGLESEAASLAGPSVDAEAWSWRKIAAKQGVAWHVSLIEEDDEHHPARVAGTWARMVSEDYGHDMPSNAPLAWCVAYLDRNLHRIAQDDAQDFDLMRSELRRCRQHLEAVLHNDTKPDRGVPCPECTSQETGVGPRLRREYAHWCESPACLKREHPTDAAGDEWVCPKCHSRWTHANYEAFVEERRDYRCGAWPS